MLSLKFFLILPLSAMCIEEDSVLSFEDKFEKLKHELDGRMSKLEELTKVSTVRSCSEYADFGVKTTGLYMIDPDGPLIGHEPFQVLCNFTTGSTEILHDTGKLSKIEHCRAPGCYEKTVTYKGGATNLPIPLSQIKALKEISEYCVQGFYYECILAPFQDEYLDYAFWTDIHGEKNVYYTGANKGTHICDCHYTEEGCYQKNKYQKNTCNCDSNIFSDDPLSDSGTISNTTALPVTKLSFGGLTNSHQKGAFKLGNLRCFGKTETEIGSSCSSLKLKGTMASGYYDIKKPGDKYTSLVYCDMNVDGYHKVQETDLPDRSSPLGTIAAWVSKPASGAASEEIPDGWVLCDGRIIEKGTWAGNRTPSINDGKFLRGGSLGQQLQHEQDQVQNHLHTVTDPGHTHTASSTSSSHNHGYSDYYIKGGNGDYPYYCFSQRCPAGDGPTSHSSKTNSAIVTVSTTVNKTTTGMRISGVTAAYRSGSETRPKNLKISWIMKCW